MKINLTLETLEKHGACVEAVDWFKTQGKTDAKSLLDACIREDHLDWASWMLVRLLSHQNQVRYAVYAAKQVIGIFEKKYPEDNQPREAIKAAEKWLRKPTEGNVRAAADAAAFAAYATYAASAAAFAADAAADAAASAAYATSAASAADAAYAAADAADAAADAADAAASAEMKIKILKYGYRLLMKQGGIK